MCWNRATNYNSLQVNRSHFEKFGNHCPKPYLFRMTLFSTKWKITCFHGNWLPDAPWDKERKTHFLENQLRSTAVEIQEEWILYCEELFNTFEYSAHMHTKLTYFTLLLCGCPTFFFLQSTSKFLSLFGYFLRKIKRFLLCRMQQGLRNSHNTAKAFVLQRKHRHLPLDHTLQSL